MRDAKGRFASKGYVGQTGGRGARLKAAGKKREGGGAKVKVTTAPTKGTIKPKSRSVVTKPAGQLKPKKARIDRIKGNYRPENLFSRTNTKYDQGYGTDAKKNIAEARRRIEAAGASSVLKSNKRSSTVGSVDARNPNQVQLNASHPTWRNPKAEALKDRRQNKFSTTSAHHFAAHELGHVKNPTSKMASSWDTQLRKKGQIYADAEAVLGAKRLARRVSRYAMQSPAEFTAEVSAGLKLGKKYDTNVMRLYRDIQGKKQGRRIKGVSRLSQSSKRRRR